MFGHGTGVTPSSQTAALLVVAGRVEHGYFATRPLGAILHAWECRRPFYSWTRRRSLSDADYHWVFFVRSFASHRVSISAQRRSHARGALCRPVSVFSCGSDPTPNVATPQRACLRSS